MAADPPALPEAKHSHRIIQSAITVFYQTMAAIRFIANLMAAVSLSFCHRNCPPKSKTLMSNISGTPVFAGFVGSSGTFKTSAFNHSAISPEEKPASAAGIPGKVNAQNGVLVGLMGCFRAVWVARRFWELSGIGLSLIPGQMTG